MGCTTTIVKYLLFAFNLAFVIAAIAFIAVGVVFKLNLDDFTEVIEKLDFNFGVAPTLMIIVGVVVFIIAFFGCCGAIKEGTCMLTTYAVILLTIFILQVALGVYAFLQLKDSDAATIKGDINRELLSAMNKYTTDENARKAIDAVQEGVECCGVNGPDDWKDIFTNGSAPLSCCTDQPVDCPRSSAYEDGCTELLYDFIKNSLKTIGIVVIVIGSVELIGGIIALCLASCIRNNDRRRGYA